MLSPGATCTCRQTGNVVWVVKEPLPDNRLRLIGVRTDRRGRADYSTRICGAGDAIVIRDAESYAVGDVIERHGLRHVVLSDDGDSVTLAVPEDHVPLRGGYTVHVALGNKTIVSKADLTLATMFGELKKKEKQT